MTMLINTLKSTIKKMNSSMLNEIRRVRYIKKRTELSKKIFQDKYKI